jgi:prolyl 4-hydroxylase
VIMDLRMLSILRTKVIMLMRYSIDSLCLLSNSSGVFLSASEDSSGTLDVIEKKIAKATMLPRIHGEVLVIVFIIIIMITLCLG